MQKIIAPITAVLLLSCSSSYMMRGSNINKQIDRIRIKIERDHGYVTEINKIRLGKTGYLYMLDAQGRIISHPKSALVGLSFKDNPVVQYIIHNKKGCIRQSIEGRIRIVFFAPVERIGFLCLSVPPEELDRKTDLSRCVNQ